MYKIFEHFSEGNRHNKIKRIETTTGAGTTLTPLNPYSAKVIYLNFQPLEVVSRCRDPQPQVVENDSYLFNLRPNI